MAESEAEPTPDACLATAHGLVAPKADRLDSTRLGPLEIVHRQQGYYDINHLDGDVSVVLDTVNVDAVPAAGVLAGYLHWLVSQIEARDGESLAVTPGEQVEWWS